VTGIGIPLFMLFMFGFALSLDVDHVSTVVWDQSMTHQSRDLISRFAGSRYFSLIGFVNNYKALKQDIDKRKVMMGLVIPIGFAEKVESGQKARVQVILDGSDANTASIILGYANAIVQGYSAKVQLKYLNRYGEQPAVGQAELDPVIWFNSNLESKYFLVPGLIVLIMMVIGTLLTSLTIAKEWENGTIEQLLSSPVTPFEVVVGKFIPYFCLGMFDMIICLAVGVFVFHIAFRGSLLLFFLLSGLYLSGTLGTGMLISILTRKQLNANQVAMMVSFLPSFLLSGFVFPVSNMPKILQAITYLVPARYFIIVVRGVYLKGVGIRSLWLQSLFLLLFAGITFAASLHFYKRRLE
jgi:ABC-2 type transport system permease protein